MEMFSGDTFFGNIPKVLPIIPTVDVVVFPNTIVPLLVLDEKIINGINRSLEETKMILLLASQKQSDQSEAHLTAIGTKDLYSVGTVASVMRLIKVPEGGVKILVQGVCKAHVNEFIMSDNMLQAKIELIAFN